MKKFVGIIIIVLLIVNGGETINAQRVLHNKWVSSKGDSVFSYYMTSFIVYYNDQVPPHAADATLTGMDLIVEDSLLHPKFRVINVPGCLSTRKRYYNHVMENMERVKRLPFIEHVTPNITWERCLNINIDKVVSSATVSVGNQWSLDDNEPYSINAETAWGISTGENVKIAVLDMGYDMWHPDINYSSSKIDVVSQIEHGPEPGPEWIEYGHHPEDDELYGELRYRLYDYATSDYSDSLDTIIENDYIHGTAVSGIMSGKGINIKGVAPSATIIPVRIGTVRLTVHQLDYNWPTEGYEGGLPPPEYEPNWVDKRLIYPTWNSFKDICDYDDVIRGINWATHEAGVDIINMSFVMRGITSSQIHAIQQAVYDARAEGVILVAASGDGGPSSSYPPANLFSVISVGALDRDGYIWDDSSYKSSDYPNVVAPGVNVWSTLPRSALPWVPSAAATKEAYDINPPHIGPGPWNGQHRYFYFQDNVLYETDGNWDDDSGWDGYDYTYCGAIDGVSIATPHVSGAVAVMRSWIPSLQLYHTLDILTATARPTNSGIADGAGLLDIGNAMTRMVLPDFEAVLQYGLNKQAGIDAAPPGGGSPVVILSWSCGNPVNDIDKYYIYRKSEGGNWGYPHSPLATIDSSILSYQDWMVDSGETYEYVVYGWCEEGLRTRWVVDNGAHIVRTVIKSKSIEEEPGDPLDQNEASTVSAPTVLTLNQNYPNPFNPTTEVRYGLPTSTRVNLRIMNIRGQTVRTLVDEEKPAGWYTVTWDGKNESGRQVSSGIYLYLLETNEGSILKKMTLIR